MKVSELGEFRLIERLKELIAQRQPASSPGPSLTAPAAPHLLLAIGDDCAVWQAGELVQISTTDTLVQDVHFGLDTISWKDLGWKALAVNLSDIAAMGGIPDYALVTVGLPGETPVEGILALYQGMLECADEYGTRLAGGDIVGSPRLFISVTLLGRAGGAIPFPNNVLLRSASTPGDAIGVTGQLGSSAAGLRLLSNPTSPPSLSFAVEAHNRPIPRLATGRLALEAGIRCGMDVSDGLIGDLEKLCTASRVAAEIELARVPVREEVRRAFPGEWPQLALAGGEDYELLLVGPAEVLVAVRERCSVPLALIGRMVDGPPGMVAVRNEQGRIVDLSRGGWDHLLRG